MAFTIQTNSPVGPDNLGFPWTFLVGSKSPNDSLFEHTSAQVVETMLINWSDREKAVKAILGHPARRDALATKLHRQLPMKHPDWYWLYASKISTMKGVNFLGTKTNKSRGSFPVYEFCELHILYSTRPYKMLEDHVVGNVGAGGEKRRFVEKVPAPKAEILTSDRGQWQWNDPAAPLISSNTIKGGVGYPIAKTMLQWKWHDVPDAFVMNASGVPTNILSCLNKVNDAEFEGFAAGTLLCDSPSFEPTEMPINPQDLGLEATEPARTWKITLNLKYFNPQTDSAFKGHNLAPHPSSAAGNWYRITTAVGRTLFQSTSFDTIFTAV